MNEKEHCSSTSTSIDNYVDLVSTLYIKPAQLADTPLLQLPHDATLLLKHAPSDCSTATQKPAIAEL